MRKTNGLKILIGRHGEDLPSGELKESYISTLHGNGSSALGKYIADNRLSVDDAVIWHSGVRRTYDTGLSYMVGAYGLSVPDSLSSLRNYDGLAGLTRVEDPEMAGEWINIDENVMEEVGRDEYFRRWMNGDDFSKTSAFEAPATTWETMENTSGGILLKAIRDCYKENFSVGALISHGGVVESMFSAAVNSSIYRSNLLSKLGKGHPLLSYDEMGGEFRKGDYAILSIDSNGLRKQESASIERKGKTYPVDLFKIVGNYYENRLFV